MKIDKCERICKYCEYSSALFYKSAVLCSHKGVVDCGYSCKKFSYDPLKREPSKVQNAPELEFVNIDEE